MSARTFELVLAAGEEREIAASGEFITCIRSTLTTFRVGFDRSPNMEFRPGLTYRPPRPFRTVQLGNTGTVSQTIEVTIGAGFLVDSRSVSSAPDSFEPVTLEDVRELGFFTTGTSSGAASEFSHVQVWNPASSGVVAVVRQLIVTCNTAGQVVIRLYNTALADLAGQSKAAYLGDDEGVVQSRTEEGLAEIGANSDNRINFRLVANETLIVTPPTPLILPASSGLLAFHASANVSLKMGVSLLEIPG